MVALSLSVQETSKQEVVHRAEERERALCREVTQLREEKLCLQQEEAMLAQANKEHVREIAVS